MPPKKQEYPPNLLNFSAVNERLIIKLNKSKNRIIFCDYTPRNRSRRSILSNISTKSNIVATFLSECFLKALPID